MLDKSVNIREEAHRAVAATLSNGMRVAARQTAGNAASYIGVVVNAGSRDEDSAHEGLAHFVEHTIFKGTRKRRSFHISSRMESVGGELNAYTSKEETVLYTNAPVGYAGRALELLADLVAESRFPAHELDMERSVVVEEINSYLDSPADLVYDLYEEEIYRGSGLSHNILGTPESVERLDTTACLDFLHSNYTPDNMVLYIADPRPVEKSIREAERYFGSLSGTRTTSHLRTPPPAHPTFRQRKDNAGNQAHTITGCRLFPRTDPRRFALYLLNNYLGGPAMNSRLNQELRDRRGLVYSVDSNFSLLSDTGLLTIYFGSSRDTVDRCLRLITREIEKLAEKPLSERTLDAIKRQYTGQLSITADNTENRAMSMAKTLLYYGEIVELDDTIRQLRHVTPDDIRDIARMLTERSTLTIS